MTKAIVFVLLLFVAVMLAVFAVAYALGCLLLLLVSIFIQSREDKRRAQQWFV